MREIKIPQGMQSYLVIDEKQLRGLSREVLKSDLPAPVIGKIDSILSAVATGRLVGDDDHVSLKELRDAVRTLASGKKPETSITTK